MALSVRVVAPDATVWEGEAEAVTAPAWDGGVGILPGHAPMIVLLGHGLLAIRIPGGRSATFHVAGGVLKVDSDEVIVLTEYAGEEPPSAIPPAAIVYPEDVAAVAG